MFSLSLSRKLILQFRWCLKFQIMEFVRVNMCVFVRVCVNGENDESDDNDVVLLSALEWNMAGGRARVRMNVLAPNPKKDDAVQVVTNYLWTWQTFVVSHNN